MKLNKIEKFVLLAVTAAAVATCYSAKADFGDTIASSEAKYGKGTVVAPSIVYSHNGWWIQATYNVNEICVMIEFMRLDGKPVTKAQARNMDTHNLPAYTLNSSRQWMG